MKTNAFRYLGLALMAVLTLSLTSCEVEIDSFYDDDNIGGGYYNRSSDLCSRTWVSFYRDVDGNRCRQELDFYLDRTGVDFILMDMWRHSNIISVGTGRIMHRLPFAWITVAMMYLTWMMYTSEEID
jgi:hypothetical protein